MPNNESNKRPAPAEEDKPQKKQQTAKPGEARREQQHGRRHARRAGRHKLEPDAKEENCTVSLTYDHGTLAETVTARMSDSISDVIRRLAALVGHTISDADNAVQMAEAPSHQGLTVAQVVEIADDVFDLGDPERPAGCWYQLAAGSAVPSATGPEDKGEGAKEPKDAKEGARAAPAPEKKEPRPSGAAQGVNRDDRDGSTWITQELLLTPDREKKTCTVSFTLDHGTPLETITAKMDDVIEDVIRRLAAEVGHKISDGPYTIQMAEATGHYGLTVTQIVEVADNAFGDYDSDDEDNGDQVRHAGCWYELATEGKDEAKAKAEAREVLSHGLCQP